MQNIVDLKERKCTDNSDFVPMQHATCVNVAKKRQKFSETKL